ncbi:hypothetical protein ACJX0J_008440 [Zea mays]
MTIFKPYNIIITISIKNKQEDAMFKIYKSRTKLFLKEFMNTREALESVADQLEEKCAFGERVARNYLIKGLVLLSASEQIHYGRKKKKGKKRKIRSLLIKIKKFFPPLQKVVQVLFIYLRMYFILLYVTYIKTMGWRRGSDLNNGDVWAHTCFLVPLHKNLAQQLSSHLV